MSKTIDIRFNTSFPEKSQYEWRIIDEFGNEALTNEFEIKNLNCFSSSRQIEGVGIKYHVRVEANKIIEEIREGRKITILQ